MKNITLFYLFFQTIAVAMLMLILAGDVDNKLLHDFERFGYSIAAFGISLMLGWLIKQRLPMHIEARQQVLITLCFYPVMLFSVHTAVTHSPKLISEQSRPAAHRMAVKILTDNTLLEADFASQLNFVIKRFPLSDEQISQLYLDSIRGLSQLLQQKDHWSKDFTEDKFEQAVKGFSYKNSQYLKYEDRFFVNYMTSIIYGGLAPLNSRTLPQLGQLGRVEYGLLKFIHGKFNQVVLSILRVVPQNHSSETEIKPLQGERHRFFTAKRTLMQIDNELKKSQTPQIFRLQPHIPKHSLEDTIKLSFTSHILNKAGLPTANLPNNVTLPYRVNGRAYQAEAEFTQLIRWLAPYMFDQTNNTLIISLRDLSNPEQVKRYEAYLTKGLPDIYKNNFLHFYHRTAFKLGTDATAWHSPVAMPLYGHFLRIGRILPWLFILSLILLIANIIRVARHGYIARLLAVVSIFSAIIIFNTPLLYWIIKPVLWFSI